MALESLHLVLSLYEAQDALVKVIDKSLKKLSLSALTFGPEFELGSFGGTITRVSFLGGGEASINIIGGHSPGILVSAAIEYLDLLVDVARAVILVVAIFESHCSCFEQSLLASES